MVSKIVVHEMGPPCRHARSRSNESRPSEAFSKTYSMSFVFRSTEMRHAIETGEGSASTLIPVTVELLLGENVTAVLDEGCHVSPKLAIGMHFPSNESNWAESCKRR